MSWQAKPGCAKHHRAAVERLVNALPASYLLPPSSGEIFEGLEYCNRRLRGYALAEGFDIVRHGGGTKALPSYRFRCIFHGSSTQNHRKLEDRVERDLEGEIVSKRRKETTNVRQLQCPWSALCSYRSMGKRGSAAKGYVLTVQNAAHEGHQLVDDPFTFPAHLKASEEFQEARRSAVEHRDQVLPYSVSRRLVDAKDLGVVLSARDYYNSVRKELPDKAKPKTIVALLRTLEEQKFVYRTRFEVEVDDEDKPVARKLVQLFFAHPQQLEAAQRFVANWVLIVDGTFNTNKLRLPLFVCVGVLSTNKTFPVAFSYCPSESAESIGFVWESLKAECFIPGIAPPRVILGDWAAGLISSIPAAFPEARFQGCDWHAVQAMLKWYRGKKRDYTSEEIDGSGEVLVKGQTNADRRIPGLHHFSWVYTKSDTLQALEANRTNLVELLRPQDRWYIDIHWRKVEEAVVHYYTLTYANLGSTSSQRVESYHPVIRRITNGQLSFEDSGKRLAATILSLLKDLSTFEHQSLRGYDRRAQLDCAAFQNLLCTISNFALKKIEEEWKSINTGEAETAVLGICRCQLLYRWGLPCKHYLRRAYETGQPIPKLLIHPRYWLLGPPISHINWQPRYPDEEYQVYTEPAEIVASGQIIMTLREQMEPEELARFDRQVEGGHQRLIAIGQQHLELQALPIGNPDPLPQARFRKKKAHGLANARGLSGAELAALDLRAREAVARVVTPDTTSAAEEEDEGLVPFSTPPRPAGESQGGTTMTLAHRPSPEQPRQRPAPFFRLFPEESEDSALPPISTAPPRLEEGPPGAPGKRKRAHTARYKQGVEQGDIGESQEAKKGRMP